MTEVKQGWERILYGLRDSALVTEEGGGGLTAGGSLHLLLHTTSCSSAELEIFKKKYV